MDINMDINKICSMVDHTELSVIAKREDILTLCADAEKYSVASVCVAPSYVKLAADTLGGRVKVCTVIGFPNGYSTTAVKCFETRDALENGADEIDMVINLGLLKDGRFCELEEEIRAIKKICKDKILKVIVETCLLTDEEIAQMCRIVHSAGADFIKTCTGFAAGKATVEDINLFKAHIGPNVRMKASSGMTTLDEGAVFVEMGCERLGSKLLVNIAKADGVTVEGGY